MVNLTTLSLAVVAVMTPFVAAANCQKGLQYCGYVALRRGNYYAQIVNELAASGQPTDPSHVQNSLFQCLGGANGDIKFLRYCGAACQDGGNNHSDTC
ncbi:hypothetical protein BDV28DRAFT_151052 [Aspergillus coremiiformis]|uniref:Uncharacterized protein n=1 Tax=Aspergillus coremiiformis TaxID=138285 RepID=A0A5N6Z2T6_9EURO|nr:hypothetical protein BDV28DRAFT_151052 [Aspergillus coremiiformis]